MAIDKLVDSTQLNTDLTSIANAIRTKGGTSAQLAFPSGFVTAIENIDTGGTSIVVTDEANTTGTTAVVTGDEISLITKTISQNGTYNASTDGADGYSSVTVNVSGGSSQTTWEEQYNENVTIADWGDAINYIQIQDYFLTHNDFIQNEIYRVTWKGNQYICIVQEQMDFYNGGSYYCIGNATLGEGSTGNNEPFFAQRWSNNLMFATTDAANSSSFTLIIEKQIINTIPTQHTIYLEFTDQTNTTIPIYYDSTLPTTALTAYIPTTYNDKIVKTASLDNVTYYTRPVEVWTTLYETNEYVNAGDPYGGLYINSLGSTAITEGSIWRITFDGTPYITIATTNSPYSSPYNTIIGNPLYAGGTDDGTSIPVAFAQNPWSAWTGWSAATVTQDTSHTIKFETTDALEIPANTQLVDYTKISAGYIESHGNFVEDNDGLKTSDYIVIKPTMTFSFVANPYYFIGFYDINKNALGAGTGLDYGTARQDNGFAEGTLNSTNIPANTVYIRITGGSQSTETQMSLIRTA